MSWNISLTMYNTLNNEGSLCEGEKLGYFDILYDKVITKGVYARYVK